MRAHVFTGRGRARLRQEIEAELGNQLGRHAAAAEAYGVEFSHLWSLIAKHMRGGKLIRPVLFLETHDAVRRSMSGAALSNDTPIESSLDRTEAVRIAVAIETLHFAFLLHDDVIDGDVMRRGQKNLVGELVGVDPEMRPITVREDARHWGETGGILAGDLLLSAAHQMFARAEVPHENRLRLLDLLDHTITETTAGELVDVGLSDGVIAPDLNTVLGMTQRKTASYSFELPLRAAAILAGGSIELERALSSAGAHLGLAYQLQDDLMSVFGDPAEHGKDPISDLRGGKQTALVCFARMTSAWPSIEESLGNLQLTVEDADHMRTLFEESGAGRFVRGLIEEQLTACYEVLAVCSDGEQIPAEVRTVLLDLVARIEGRKS